MYDKEESGYLIEKSSGAGGRGLDRRRLEKQTREEADSMFRSIVREKTNPAGKSPHLYRIVQQ